jgi:hypothetical protein
MKPWMPFQIQSVTSWEELRRFSSQGFQNLYQLMNGNIGFLDNINCQVQSVTLTTSPVAINHTLNKVPIGYLVLNQNANASVYSATLVWSDKTIYLQSSASVYVKLAILGG